MPEENAAKRNGNLLGIEWMEEWLLFTAPSA
jgi:hypothetical protein